MLGGYLRGRSLEVEEEGGGSGERVGVLGCVVCRSRVYGRKEK